MAHDRGRILGLAASGFLAVFALGAPSALAQEAGDRVEVTLTSGKSYTGTLVSRDEREVKIRIGTTEIGLPVGFVKSVAKAAPRPEPVPEKPADAGPAAGPSASPGGAPAAGGPPRPATILLKDGTVLEGYVIARDGAGLWIVPAGARCIPADSVDKVYGESEGLGGGGLRITGDAMRDCMALLKEVESEDKVRQRAALAALDGYGKQAIPALLKGMEAEGQDTRHFCIGVLSGMRSPEALDPILKALRADPSPRVRTAAAEAAVLYDSPLTRRALLEVAWRDRDETVKRTAVSALHRIGTVEEVPALMDLLAILPEESHARSIVFDALRKATKQKYASDIGLWTDWWEKNGRDDIAKKIEVEVQKRLSQEYGPPLDLTK